jgi:hypothetical protein
MSWGPSDELEWREEQAARRASERAYREWWATGVSGAPAPGDEDEPEEEE